jgi:hypothetical protein
MPKYKSQKKGYSRVAFELPSALMRALMDRRDDMSCKAGDVVPISEVVRTVLAKALKVIL